MSNPKSKLFKTLMTAPLAATLILGATGCSTTPPTVNNDIKMPDDVKANIENTLSTTLGLATSEKFMQSVVEFSMDGGDFAGFENEKEILDGLVAEDASLEGVKENAKKSVEEADDAKLELLAKTAPLVLLSYSYALEDPKTVVEIDATAFEEKDGAWVQKKDGAIGFKDSNDRYVAFTLVADNLSFTSDGKQLSLSSLSESLEEAEKAETTTFADTRRASMVAGEWLEKQGPGTPTDLDLREKQDEIFKAFDPEGDTQLVIEGNLSEGFIITGKSPETGEEVVYDYATGLLNSSFSEDEENPAATDGLQLFDEYLTAYYSSVEDDEQYDTLDQLVVTVNSNDKLKEAKWSISELDGKQYPVVSFNGKEYKFYNVTTEAAPEGEAPAETAPEEAAPVG